jgi:hypothetical protein
MIVCLQKGGSDPLLKAFQSTSTSISPTSNLKKTIKNYLFGSAAMGIFS